MTTCSLHSLNHVVEKRIVEAVDDGVAIRQSRSQTSQRRSRSKRTKGSRAKWHVESELNNCIASKVEARLRE